MLISCKCLNFIATSKSQQQKSISHAAVGTADASHPPSDNAAVAAAPPSNGHSTVSAFCIDEDCSMSSNGGGGGSVSTGVSAGVGGGGSSSTVNSVGGQSLANDLLHAFLQKYPRNFTFYSQCMDFFKQSIGPIPDLAINAINQRDLIYSLTLEIIQQQPTNNGTTNHIMLNTQCQTQAWQISICINCNTALCAKRLSGSPQTPEIGNVGPQLQQQQYLINCSLLTNNEELMQRRSNKSFSETFGLLIMDHPLLEANTMAASNGPQQAAQSTNVIGSFSIGGGGAFIIDPKQQRLKQLQQNLQARLQKEIADTDERIQRYTEQQFALLKSFREKSEQEYKLLVNLIQRVPEHCELLDRTPPALDVNGGGAIGFGIGAGSYAQRRRNTIGSRRDLNLSQPTTPTTAPLSLLSSFNQAAMINNIQQTQLQHQQSNSSVSAIADVTPPTTATAAAANKQQFNNVVVFNNRKMSNFDTPPATPEATPMSVGNSPTFRQQQQQQQQNSFGGARLTTSNSFQQQFPTPTTEQTDDCLFELEGVDDGHTTINNYMSNAASGATYQQHVPLAINSNQHHHHYHYLQQQQRNHHDMSDLDESGGDSAEEAEDALDSMPIPMHDGRRRPTINFGKSLPIGIANSPLAERTIITDQYEDQDLDNNVDIAASIKALAKSVHGEAVFGDLPRPRLRSQI